MSRFTVNGQPVHYRMDPDTPLLWALRDASNLTGTKYGCGTGHCGACTVHVDGRAVPSCRIRIADLGTLQRLTHLVPDGIVRELAYTGRRMGAEEAARLGLVNRVEADRDSVVAAGLDLARTIAAKSPLAVAGAKMSLNYSRGRTVEEGLRHVALWNAGALVSADLTAAVQGRLSKQVPEFKDLAD